MRTFTEKIRCSSVFGFLVETSSSLDVSLPSELPSSVLAGVSLALSVVFPSQSSNSTSSK